MFSYDYPHPAVSTDIVVLHREPARLRVLLIQRNNDPYRDYWALPGGFVNIDEDLEDAALRELAEETGLSDVLLSQLHTFGHPDRDPRERVISIVFYAVVDEEQQLRAGSDAADASWFEVDALPQLAFDHAEIIAMARQRLLTQDALVGDSPR